MLPAADHLVCKAHELGYHSQVILAGRAVNDYMPRHVAELAINNGLAERVSGEHVRRRTTARGQEALAHCGG